MRKVNLFSSKEFDTLVVETYGKPYKFQQQDGCKDRGVEEFTVPVEEPYDYDDQDDVGGGGTLFSEYGVPFQTWLARDVTDLFSGNNTTNELIWHREFYPSVEMVLNDLHEKGILEAGEYVISIDW